VEDGKAEAKRDEAVLTMPLCDFSTRQAHLILKGDGEEEHARRWPSLPEAARPRSWPRNCWASSASGDEAVADGRIESTWPAIASFIWSSSPFTSRMQPEARPV